MCLSLVRHMSHLFKFLTQTLTLHSRQAEHSSLCILRHVYPRVSVCFALTLTTFKRSSGTTANLLLVVQVNLMFGAIPILSGSNLSDFPIHFPELGNTHLHCDTAVCMETCNDTIRGCFSHNFSETPITILRQNDILTSNYVV